MWISITDDEGVVLERWYIGEEAGIKTKVIEKLLEKEFVLAADKEDYKFLVD